MAQVQPILLNGEWVQSASEKTFKAVNPATKEEHHIAFPVHAPVALAPFVAAPLLRPPARPPTIA